MKKTGAEIFVESLREEGVQGVFGIPGGVVLKLSMFSAKRRKLNLS